MSAVNPRFNCLVSTFVLCLSLHTHIFFSRATALHHQTRRCCLPKKSPHQSCWQKDPPVFQVTATELTVFTLWHLFKVTAWARYLISLTLLKLASTPECSYAVNFVENKHKFTKAAKKAHHGQRNAVQQRETACLRIGGEVTSQTTL